MSLVQELYAHCTMSSFSCLACICCCSCWLDVVLRLVLLFLSHKQYNLEILSICIASHNLDSNGPPELLQHGGKGSLFPLCVDQRCECPSKITCCYFFCQGDNCLFKISSNLSCKPTSYVWFVWSNILQAKIWTKIWTNFSQSWIILCIRTHILLKKAHSCALRGSRLSLTQNLLCILV